MSLKRSRVYSPYRTKYRVSNTAKNDRALAQRGCITMKLSAAAIKKWNARITVLPMAQRDSRNRSDVGVQYPQ